MEYFSSAFYLTILGLACIAAALGIIAGLITLEFRK